MSERVVRHPRVRLPAAVLAVCFALAACDVDPAAEPTPAPTPTPSPTIAPGVETPAAELRAAVGVLVQGHVYLLGVVTGTQLREGSESPALVRAQATLDDNTAALAEIVAEAFGEQAAGRFTDLWRAQVGYVSDYARGYDEGDDALRTAMAEELSTFRIDLGRLLDELTNGVVPAETAAAQIEPMFEGELEVVDAQAAGGDVTGELRETAGDVPPVADLLAGAIVVHEPDRYRDSIEAPSSLLRSTMQALFQEHVYLLGYAVDAGFRQGFDSSSHAAARATLDANVDAMAELWRDDHGASSANAFRTTWQNEVDAFVAYAQGSATAEDDLDVFRASLAQIVQEETAQVLDRDVFEDELTVHTDAVTEAIDALRDGDQQWSDRWRAAAGHAAVVGDVIATATIQRFPDRYGPES